MSSSKKDVCPGVFAFSCFSTSSSGYILSARKFCILNTKTSSINLKHAEKRLGRRCADKKTLGVWRRDRKHTHLALVCSGVATDQTSNPQCPLDQNPPSPASRTMADKEFSSNFRTATYFFAKSISACQE